MQDYLYATTWGSLDADGEIKVIRANDDDYNAGTVIQTLTHSGPSLGIATMDEDDQPGELNGVEGTGINWPGANS